MDEIECKYVGRTFPGVEAPIAFGLERKDGHGQFLIILSADDARNLRDDLDYMLLASGQPNN